MEIVSQNRKDILQRLVCFMELWIYGMKDTSKAAAKYPNMDTWYFVIFFSSVYNPDITTSIIYTIQLQLNLIGYGCYLSVCIWKSHNLLFIVLMFYCLLMFVSTQSLLAEMGGI